MAEEVVVSKEAAGLLATVLGWGLSIFYQGRKIGRLEEQFLAARRQLTDTVSKVEALGAEHDKDMKDLANWFRTDSGGQKFMTFPDHDLICNRNAKTTTQAIGQMTEAVKGLTTQMAIMSEQFHDLKVSVAVLQASTDNAGKGRSRPSAITTNQG